MNGRVAKPRRRGSRAKLSKPSQEKLLDAALSQVSGQTPAQTAPPESSRTRQIDATAELDRLPAKQACPKGTDTQLVGVEEEEATEATSRRTSPTPSKRPHASSLEVTALEPDNPTPIPPRKRPITRDNDDNDRRLKRTRLTRNNLALFDKMAKKRGNNKASAPGHPESTAESSTTRTTSTTSSGFAIQAYKNGIFDPVSSKPPKNLKEIRKKLAESRATASPPESVYEDYVDTIGGAVNEATMVGEMLPLLKTYPKEGYKKALNQAFTGFPKEVGFNNGLSAPQPDFVEGLRMGDFRPFPVDEHVSGAVFYRDNPHSLTLAHVAGEWKGPGKDMEEARLQTAYDGAALVYARNQALDYMGEPDPPGHAAVTTFTTDGTNLNFYAHYSAPSEDGTPEYHQYPVTSTNLKNSYEEFKQGRRQLRNDQDHARAQSYALKDQLKEHWKTHGAAGSLHPIAEAAPPPDPGEQQPLLDTTNPYEEVDVEPEPEPGYEMIASQPLTPATSSKHQHRHGKARSSGSSSTTTTTTTTNSKPLPPVNYDVPGSSGHKRKASSSSQGSSHGSSGRKGKEREYWEKDVASGRYFHRHSNGGVTWYEEGGDRY